MPNLPDYHVNAENYLVFTDENQDRVLISHKRDQTYCVVIQINGVDLPVMFEPITEDEQVVINFCFDLEGEISDILEHYAEKTRITSHALVERITTVISYVLQIAYLEKAFKIDSVKPS